MLQAQNLKNNSAEVDDIEVEDVARRLEIHEAARERSLRFGIGRDLKQMDEKHILRRMLPGYVANFVRRVAPILNMQLQGDLQPILVSQPMIYRHKPVWKKCSLAILALGIQS